MTKSWWILLTLAVIAGVGCSQRSESNPPSVGSNTSSDAGKASGLVTEHVGVPDCDVRYPTPIESTVGSKKERLVLTGAGLRTKFAFNVYAIGSYIQEGIGVSSAEELCNADCSKQLHLVMQRNVTGKEMADAFAEAIRRNYPKPAFDAEISALSGKLRTIDLAKGANVWLTNVPSAGLNLKVVGLLDCQIEGVAFSKAIWEIYLGKKNLGETLKVALVSRLK
jgi:hypothetical protein